MRQLRQKFIQGVRLCDIMVAMSTYTLLSTASAEVESLSDISDNKTAYIYRKLRTPSSYYPSDSEILIPFKPKTWASELMAEDNKGVLVSVRATISNWQSIQNWNNKWRLRSTGQYVEVTDKVKKKYLGQKLLRYADKRLMGEIKSAEKGSTLYKVGKVRKALKPQTNVSFSKRFKLKFSAKVLRGLIIMRFDNPWIESYVEFKAFKNINVFSKEGQVGKTDLWLRKNWKKMGLKAEADIKFYNQNWTISMTKKLTETVDFRLSSIQDNSAMPLSGESQKVGIFLYSIAF